jgi:acetyl esterase/lipase
MRRFWKLMNIVLNVVPNPAARLVMLFRQDPTIETTSYTTTEGAAVPMRIHHPSDDGPTPALIIYPGASPAAEEHEAVNVLARALASAGIRTFLPRIPDLKEVLVREESVEHIINVYLAVEVREDVDPARIVGSGVSFGGSLFIKACLDNRLKGKPAAVFSYGSYFDFSEGLQFSMTGACSDGENEYHIEPHDWGRIAFFHNYLEHLDEPCNPENIHRYLLDEVANDGEEGESLYETFPEEDRAVIDKIVSDQSEEAVAMAENVLKKIEPMVARLSPSTFLDKIDFPVHLMHGANDNMIPFTETVRFAKALAENGGEVHSFVSYLYSHSEIEGHGKGLFGFISELWRMGRFLGSVLRPVL